jgi:hypothetical protein
MATAGSKRPHEVSLEVYPLSKPKLSLCRCATMKGTVTIKEILDEVIDMDPKHEAAIATFILCFSCHECRSVDHGYTTIHGVENLVNAIPSFFTYFCPRDLCTPKQAEIYDKTYARRHALHKKKDMLRRQTRRQVLSQGHRPQESAKATTAEPPFTTQVVDSLQHKDKGTEEMMFLAFRQENLIQPFADFPACLKKYAMMVIAKYKWM